MPENPQPKSTGPSNSSKFGAPTPTLYNADFLRNEGAVSVLRGNEENLRAENQGFSDALSASLSRLTQSSLVNGSASLLGAAIGISDAVTNWDRSKLFDNGITKSATASLENIATSNPVYSTDEEKAQTGLARVFSPNAEFWGNTMIDAAAFMGGEALAGVATAGLSSLGELRALKNGAKLFKLNQGKSAKELAETFGEQAAKLNLAGFGKAAIQSHFEASFEASGVLKDLYESAEQRERESIAKRTNTPVEQVTLDESTEKRLYKQASEYANSVYLTNLLLLSVFQTPLTKSAATGFRAARNSGRSVFDTFLREGEGLTKASFANKLARGVAKMSTSGAGESIQELGQTLAADLAQGGMDGKYNGQNFVSAFASQLSETFNSKEGSEGMLAGAVLGMLGGVGGVRETFKNYANDKKMYDDFQASYLDNITNNSTLSLAYQRAVSQGEREIASVNYASQGESKRKAVNDIRSEQLFDSVIAADKVGRMSDLENSIQDLENGTLSAYDERMGTDFSQVEKESQGTGEELRQKQIGNLRTNINQIFKIRKSLESTLPQSIDVDEINALTKVGFLTYDSNERVAQLQEKLNTVGVKDLSDESRKQVFSKEFAQTLLSQGLDKETYINAFLDAEKLSKEAEFFSTSYAALRSKISNKVGSFERAAREQVVKPTKDQVAQEKAFEAQSTATPTSIPTAPQDASSDPLGDLGLTDNLGGEVSPTAPTEPPVAPISLPTNIDRPLDEQEKQASTELTQQLVGTTPVVTEVNTYADVVDLANQILVALKTGKDATALITQYETSTRGSSSILDIPVRAIRTDGKFRSGLLRFKNVPSELILVQTKAWLKELGGDKPALEYPIDIGLIAQFTDSWEVGLLEGKAGENVKAWDKIKAVSGSRLVEGYIDNNDIAALQEYQSPLNNKGALFQQRLKNIKLLAATLKANTGMPLEVGHQLSIEYVVRGKGAFIQIHWNDKGTYRDIGRLPFGNDLKANSAIEKYLEQLSSTEKAKGIKNTINDIYNTYVSQAQATPGTKIPITATVNLRARFEFDLEEKGRYEYLDGSPMENSKAAMIEQYLPVLAEYHKVMKEMIVVKSPTDLPALITVDTSTSGAYRPRFVEGLEAQSVSTDEIEAVFDAIDRREVDGYDYYMLTRDAFGNLEPVVVKRKVVTKAQTLNTLDGIDFSASSENLPTLIFDRSGAKVKASNMKLGFKHSDGIVNLVLTSELGEAVIPARVDIDALNQAVGQTLTDFLRENFDFASSTEAINNLFEAEQNTGKPKELFARISALSMPDSYYSDKATMGRRLIPQLVADDPVQVSIELYLPQTKAEEPIPIIKEIGLDQPIVEVPNGLKYESQLTKAGYTKAQIQALHTNVVLEPWTDIESGEKHFDRIPAIEYLNSRAPRGAFKKDAPKLDLVLKNLKSTIEEYLIPNKEITKDDLPEVLQKSRLAVYSSATLAERALDEVERVKAGELEKIISKILPSSIEVKNLSEKFVAIGSSQIFASFLKNTITLYKGAKRKDVYHEAFHAVFRTLYSQSEREYMLKIARETFTLDTKKVKTLKSLHAQLISETTLEYDARIEELFYEEQLADDFSRYSLENKKNILVRFWEALKATIKALATNTNLLEREYKRILSGEFQSRTPSIVREDATFKTDEKLTSEEQTAIAKYAAFYYVASSNKEALSTDKGLRDLVVYNVIPKMLSEVLDFHPQASRVSSSRGSFNSIRIEEDSPIIEEIRERIQLFTSNEELLAGTSKDRDLQLQDEDVLSQELEEDISESAENQSQTDEETVKSRDFDALQAEIDPFATASRRLKAWLDNLFEATRNDGKVEFIHFLDSYTAFQSLTRILSGTTTIEQMLDKLESYAVVNKDYRLIWNRLSQVEDISLLSGFFTAFETLPVTMMSVKSFDEGGLHLQAEVQNNLPNRLRAGATQNLKRLIVKRAEYFSLAMQDAQKEPDRLVQSQKLVDALNVVGISFSSDLLNLLTTEKRSEIDSAIAERSKQGRDTSFLRDIQSSSVDLRSNLLTVGQIISGTHTIYKKDKGVGIVRYLTEGKASEVLQATLKSIYELDAELRSDMSNLPIEVGSKKLYPYSSVSRVTRSLDNIRNQKESDGSLLSTLAKDGRSFDFGYTSNLYVKDSNDVVTRNIAASEMSRADKLFFDIVASKTGGYTPFQHESATTNLTLKVDFTANLITNNDLSTSALSYFEMAKKAEIEGFAKDKSKKSFNFFEVKEGAIVQLTVIKLESLSGSEFKSLVKDMIRYKTDVLLDTVQSQNLVEALSAQFSINTKAAKDEAKVFYRDKKGDEKRQLIRARVSANLSKGLRDHLREFVARDMLVSQGYLSLVAGPYTNYKDKDRAEDMVKRAKGWLAAGPSIGAKQYVLNRIFADSQKDSADHLFTSNDGKTRALIIADHFTVFDKSNMSRPTISAAQMISALDSVTLKGNALKASVVLREELLSGEVSDKANTIFFQLEKIVEALGKQNGWGMSNYTDAQSYIRLSTEIDNKLALSEISLKDWHDAKRDVESIDTKFESKKYVVNTPNVYIKTSMLPFHAGITDNITTYEDTLKVKGANRGYEKLLDLADVVTHTSGFKYQGQEPLYYDGENWIGDTNPLVIDNQDFKRQQIVSPTSTVVTDGTQLTQLIDSNGEDELPVIYNNVETTLGQMRSHLSDTMDKVRDAKFNSAQKLFNYASGTKDNPFIVYMAERLKELNVLGAEESYFDYNEGHFTVNPNFVSVVATHEKSLYSFFSKAFKLKVPGAKFVIVSGSAWKVEEIKNNITTLRDLKIHSPKMSGGKIVGFNHAEVLISQDVFEKLGLSSQDLSDLPKAKRDKLFEMLGYRIPTQAQNSMMPFKVVGVLPKSAGPIVVVPAELAYLAGSDYDIDSLFVSRREPIVTRVNGKVDLIFPDETSSVDQDYKTWRNEIIRDKKFVKLFKAKRKFFKADATSSSEVNRMATDELLKELNLPLTKEEFEKSGLSSETKLLNTLFEQRLRVLDSPLASELFKTVEPERLTKVRDALELLNPKKAIRFASDYVDRLMLRESNMMGKENTGRVANMIVTVAWLQKQKVSFNISGRSITFGSLTSHTPFIQAEDLSTAVEGKEVILIAGGDNIAEGLSELLSISVDNAKYLIASDLNLTPDIISTVAIMLGAGVSLNTAIMLANNPLVAEYERNVNLENSSPDVSVKTIAGQEKRRIYEAYRTELPRLTSRFDNDSSGDLMANPIRLASMLKENISNPSHNEALNYWFAYSLLARKAGEVSQVIKTNKGDLKDFATIQDSIDAYQSSVNKKLSDNGFTVTASNFYEAYERDSNLKGNLSRYQRLLRTGAHYGLLYAQEGNHKAFKELVNPAFIAKRVDLHKQEKLRKLQIARAVHSSMKYDLPSRLKLITKGEDSLVSLVNKLVGSDEELKDNAFIQALRIQTDGNYEYFKLYQKPASQQISEKVLLESAFDNLANYPVKADKTIEDFWGVDGETKPSLTLRDLFVEVEYLQSAFVPKPARYTRLISAQAAEPFVVAANDVLSKDITLESEELAKQFFLQNAEVSNLRSIWDATHHNLKEGSIIIAKPIGVDIQGVVYSVSRDTIELLEKSRWFKHESTVNVDNTSVKVTQLLYYVGGANEGGNLVLSFERSNPLPQTPYAAEVVYPTFKTQQEATVSKQEETTSSNYTGTNGVTIGYATIDPEVVLQNPPPISGFEDVLRFSAAHALMSGQPVTPLESTDGGYRVSPSLPTIFKTKQLGDNTVAYAFLQGVHHFLNLSNNKMSEIVDSKDVTENPVYKRFFGSLNGVVESDAHIKFLESTKVFAPAPQNSKAQGVADMLGNHKGFVLYNPDTQLKDINVSGKQKGEFIATTASQSDMLLTLIKDQDESRYNNLPKVDLSMLNEKQQLTHRELAYQSLQASVNLKEPEDGSRYYLTPEGKKYVRVSALKGFEGSGNDGITFGKINDAILRNLFMQKATSDYGVPFEKLKEFDKEVEELKEVLDAKTFESIQKDLTETASRFMAQFDDTTSSYFGHKIFLDPLQEDTMLYSEQFGVAGRPDLLTIDLDGYVHIWDFKALRNELSGESKLTYGLQQNMYAIMLMGRGLPVKSMNLVITSVEWAGKEQILGVNSSILRKESPRHLTTMIEPFTTIWSPKRVADLKDGYGSLFGKLGTEEQKLEAREVRKKLAAADRFDSGTYDTVMRNVVFAKGDDMVQVLISARNTPAIVHRFEPTTTTLELSQDESLARDVINNCK